MRRRAPLGRIVLAVAWLSAPAAAQQKAPGGGEFNCSLVIGYSQVNQWYRGFESVAGSDRWELLWNGGAGVDKWSDPDYSGWNNKLISPCKERSGDPDRVVLSVSGPYGDRVDTWTQKLRETLENIRLRYKNVRQVVILPVVGGKNHEACPVPGGGGGTVRASAQHPFIEQVIASVVAEDKTGLLVQGPCAQVRSCTDYRDAVGHLTGEAEEPAGWAIADWFVKR
jgi:hypothetical protein